MALTRLPSFTLLGTDSFTFGNASVSGNVTAGNIKTDHLLYANGSAYVFTTNAAGSNTQIQFNDGNSFAGNAGLTFNKTTTTLTANNFVATTTANLGAVGNVTITGGSANQLLKTNGSGSLSWVTPTGTSIAVDNFTGDGSTVAFTLTPTPQSKEYTMVSLAGTLQPRTVYSLSGNVITFSSAPPSTAPIEVTTFTSVFGFAAGGSGGAVDSVNGHTGTVVLTTTDVAEGVANLYFSNARARTAVSSNSSGPISYNSSTGVFDITSSANIAANVITANSIVNSGSGTPTLNSSTSINLTAATVVRVTTSPMQFYNCTTTVRDTIAASNGYVIYNTTTNKLQVYANGSWVDLH